ncbi:MAG: F0F1 ATP synthase subunit A [Roseburia faecis]
MITAQKIKTSGLGGYLKGFTTPIAVMTPFNVLSELATPVSMACRHFGNILSGVVINASDLRSAGNWPATRCWV